MRFLAQDELNYYLLHEILLKDLYSSWKTLKKIYFKKLTILDFNQVSKFMEKKNSKAFNAKNFSDFL
jgi:hypothetical protein